MTNLFDTKQRVTVEEVFENPDFAVSIRNEVDCLCNFICPDRADDQGHLPEICNYAFHPTSEQQRHPNVAKYAAAATKCLSSPSNVIGRRLARSTWFMDHIQSLFKDEAVLTNPIHAGHLQTTVLAVVRRNSEDLLDGPFSNLFSIVLDHVDLLGWQEALQSLAVDWSDKFGSNLIWGDDDPQILAYRVIAHRAWDFATDLKVPEETDRAQRRLYGLFSAMLRILTDRELEFSTFFCTDHEVIHSFVQAIITAANFGGAEPALLLGVRVLKRMIRCARLAQHTKEFADKCRVIRKFVKLMAVGFYRSHLVTDPASPKHDGDKWNEVTAFGPLDERKKRLLIDVFPVFWQGGIEYLFPIFFQNPAVSSLFNRIVVKHLARLSTANPGKFIAFLSRVNAVQLILRTWGAAMSPLSRERCYRPESTLIFNPQVFQLAQLITYGGAKWPKPQRSPDDPYGKPLPPKQVFPQPVDEPYIPDYKEYSVWVRDVLVPLYTLMVSELKQRVEDS
jgi:hypothetical protein